MPITCAAVRPTAIPNHYSVPIFDQTKTIVTGWKEVEGEQPANFVDPCMHTKIITGVVPVHLVSCVAQPAPQLNHWMDPVLNKDKTAVVAYQAQPGAPPAGLKDICKSVGTMLVLL